MMNKFEVKNMDLYYGSFHALKNINIAIPEKEITAFIGPSGCGKSTFLKSLNRMNDLVEGCRISGDILLDGVDIYKDKMDVNVLRKRVGMVFQSQLFHLGGGDGVQGGGRFVHQQNFRLHRQGAGNAQTLLLAAGHSQRAFVQAVLHFVPDGSAAQAFFHNFIQLRLTAHTVGAGTVGDVIVNAHREELALELKDRYTIVIVTHNMQQAARISDKTAFFLLGELVEMGDTERLFSTPVDKRTEDYISGRFG